MFQLYAEKTRLAVWKSEPVTSGSVNVYQVRFEFSSAWEGLERMAVFRGGGETRSVPLDESGECVIPWEVLQKPLVPLEAGVYGTRDGEDRAAGASSACARLNSARPLDGASAESLVLPTVWANLGTIQPGASPGEAARPPTPDLYERILAVLTQKQDKLTGRPGQVVGFDEDGNAVATEAITGLEEALERIPVPMTAAQLQTILYGGKEHE